MFKRKAIWFLIVVVFLLGIIQALRPASVQAAVTQCEYAVELAEKLGLGKGLSADEAISLLTKVGIVPKDGWGCEVVVTLDFLNEIQGLAIIAARKGLIPFSEEHTLAIFASLSRDMDLPSPIRPVFAGSAQPVGTGAGGGAGVASFAVPSPGPPSPPPPPAPPGGEGVASPWK